MTPRSFRSVPMTDPNYLQPDDALIERIFAEVDAETAELPEMDAAQIAYATRCVRKALAYADRPASDVRYSSQHHAELAVENAALRDALYRAGLTFTSQGIGGAA